MEPSKILFLSYVFFLMDFKSFSTNKRYEIYQKQKLDPVLRVYRFSLSKNPSYIQIGSHYIILNNGL